MVNIGCLYRSNSIHRPPTASQTNTHSHDALHVRPVGCERGVAFRHVLRLEAAGLWWSRPRAVEADRGAFQPLPLGDVAGVDAALQDVGGTGADQ